MPELLTDGFTVVPGPFPAAEADRAYEAMVAASGPDRMRRGSTSLRYDGLAETAPLFLTLLDHPPLLAAAGRVLGQEFRRSGFLARTVMAGAAAQPLHQDFPPLDADWPMLGFILMIDAFTLDNGATRFAPGSQRLTAPPPDTAAVPACGPAGALILYNGAVWHGHGANRTAAPRRSVQGAFVR